MGILRERKVGAFPLPSTRNKQERPFVELEKGVLMTIGGKGVKTSMDDA